MNNANLLLTGVAQGFEPHVISSLLTEERTPILYATAHLEDAVQLVHRLRFCLPEMSLYFFPEWDCLPYDRLDVSPDIAAQRLHVLNTLAERQRQADSSPYIVVTSCQSLLQRVVPRDHLLQYYFPIESGKKYSFEHIIEYLTAQGYTRTQTVREVGEFAVRGSILDIYPLGHKCPIRLDFFGDIVDSLRTFDPMMQTTIEKTESFVLKPCTDIPLTAETIHLFQENYRRLFSTVKTPLYESVSQGRRFGGMEHWFPLFFDHSETLLDYMPQARVLLDFQADDAVRTRLELVHDYYQNRLIHNPEDSSPPYNPVPPESLHMTLEEWGQVRSNPQTMLVSPFSEAPFPELNQSKSLDFDCRVGLPFEPSPQALNAVGSFKAFLKRQSVRPKEEIKPIFISAMSEGSRDRLLTLLQDHGISNINQIDAWPEDLNTRKESLFLMVYPLERGFETPEFILITEQDLLGEKIIRATSRKRQVDTVVLEANQLAIGDFVVHQDHGIGQYQGLVPLQVGGTFHDCLCLGYEGGDRLFLPVENIEIISKYSSEESSAQLDKLGTVGWQKRKARAKKRIREIAEYLLKLAAQRALNRGDIITIDPLAYDNFCSRFPYVETEDQQRSIEETLNDLSSGKPMDRLICGDVGFGKTEVALRAAFAVVSNKKQVALVSPTTLLCRQHFKTFQDRFRHTGFRVEQLSRFTSQAKSRQIRQDMQEGKVDIVIATHTLFSDKSKFHDLGLVIIDEEQHFGVKQKEHLKQLQSNVHVLTLTATPIPRTLQQALTGVREMSLITTPPIDRLAVRTFVMAYDSLVIREAILREYHRGGQVFFVCPRLNDMPDLEKELATLVPEIKIISAHGQLPTSQLEHIMTAFYDRQYDLLLSTNIVESGIDIANANTLIIHRSDLFGLSQLYQLRGRVGRSKAQSYAYLTLPSTEKITETARRRLEIMQNLDKLGSGFTLATQDMDVRGTGNLVGEEQSGHIREVGVELYQTMLQEAMMMVRVEQEMGEVLEEEWTPQINLGISVMIPETYVADLSLRLSLYRRIAHLQDRQEIDAFAAEMIDRFGKLPAEVQNLFDIMEIKRTCRLANIDKVDVGPNGIVMSLRNGTFPNPDKLLAYIQDPKTAARLRPDQKIVFLRQWGHSSQRSRTTKLICRKLALLGKTDVGAR